MASLLGKFRSLFSRGTPHRTQQQHLDTLEMFWYTSFYKNFKKRIKIDPTYGAQLSPEQISDLCNTELAKQLSFTTQKVTVLKELDTQVLGLLEYVNNIGGANPYPEPVFKPTQENEKKNEEENQRNTKVREYLKYRMDDAHVELFSPGKVIEHPEGFKLQIRKSNIDDPESGYGVFVEGTIIPGTVVAFYPGVVYFPEDLSKCLIDGNEYLITRYDNVVIDGYQWNQRANDYIKSKLTLIYATGQDPEQDPQLKKYRNPFGIGNYVNHPPKGHEANVLNFAYDFPASTPEHLRPYVPNTYFSKPSILYYSDALMRSIVLVAKRKIQDEEIYLNYRYNPRNPYPSWYEPPDPEESERRWGKRGWLSQ